MPIDESELNNLMLIERNNLRAAAKSIPTQAMIKTPDVRAEKVSRGKALVADPNYPSKDQIKKIASVLAAKWKGGFISSSHGSFLSNRQRSRKSSSLAVNVVSRGELAHR